MEARIADALPSVVVFAKDVAPDTVVESMTAQCTLRQYLDAGGKVVWYGDVPLYYQGHADGTRTDWGVSGSIAILGFNAAGGPWSTELPVTFTTQGEQWGLTEVWASRRPALPAGLTVLAEDPSSYAAAWVKHYVAQDAFRGFVRTSDRPGEPNLDDLRRLAVYPDPVEPLLGDNSREFADDIIAVFHYPWYGHPDTTGHWVHWTDSSHSPPLTWSANYAPDYPDSNWDPWTMLYDSTSPALLRWQDQGMARAGVDLAIGSWWGRGTFEDNALGPAIRLCKSVQWCIYYEMEAFSDPPVEDILADLRSVIDRFGPTRNYARVDGKWLVFIYVANDEDAASRWAQAKLQLRDIGYDTYINAFGSPSPLNFPDPWDAIHIYNPATRQTCTDTIATGDDSATLSPGFWLIHEAPRLERDLQEYTNAWADIVAEADRSRFILVETWNEWHEGTSIEPGQRINHDDVNGFTPTGDDYGFAFVDAIAGQANTLRWTTPGHRADLPVRLQAEAMVWELGTGPESTNAWRIYTEGARIGASLQLPLGPPAGARASIRARAVQVGPQAGWPTLAVYWGGQQIATWSVTSTDYMTYEQPMPPWDGVAAVEIALMDDPGGALDVDLIIDYIDVTWPGGLGDFDGDGDADLFDYASFAACLSGPGVSTPPTGCSPEQFSSRDLEHDYDADLSDFALFQEAFTGGGG
jgi:hypothetical protein